MFKFKKSLSKMYIKESWQDFLEDDGYWNTDTFKDTGLLTVLKYLSDVYHEFKSLEVENSSFQTMPELVRFLRDSADKLNKSADKLERMGQ